MPIKTFRGLISDGAQDTIVLHTIDGSIGYRITKFQLLAAEPGDSNAESVCKIYKVPQTTVDGKIDFSDQTLLAAGHASNSGSTYTYPPTETIIFDQEIFNQDIYITHEDSAGSIRLNYYIELEQIKLDLNENTVATLKDIRNLA